MIKRLRFKFICVNMVIVTVMLCVILGMVMHFTAQTLEMQSVSMMRTLASDPFQLGILGKNPQGVRLPYFAVQVGRRGELIAAGGGYFDLSDREFLQQIVDAAHATDAETGLLEEYDLRFCKAMSPGGQSIVFADTTSEEITMRNLLYSCLFIGVVSFLLFFGVSIALSRWAVKPVEKAWEQQRQFVADASHELKTPLAVIMTNAELLQGDSYPEEDRKGFAGRILTVSYQMRTLVESLLEMARVDNGSVKMDMKRVDFSRLVRDAVLSVQLLYEERGMGLRSAIVEDVYMEGSEQHLYQVLDVLLDNALKYSTPAGEILVTLERRGHSALLRVDSPGEAISQEDLKNIFKRFYRIDRARTMNGSCGLGLSIAEGIVKAHKGNIWAESKDGTNRFYVQLPLL